MRQQPQVTPTTVFWIHTSLHSQSPQHEATAHILLTPYQTLETTAYFTSPHTLKAPVVTCPGCIPGLGTLFGHSLGFLPLVFKDHHSVWGFWKDMMKIALLAGDICFQAKYQCLFRELMF